MKTIAAIFPNRCARIGAQYACRLSADGAVSGVTGNSSTRRIDVRQLDEDLAVVRFISDKVLVMKDGQVVEQASAAQILAAPQQDYTRRLLGAVPRGWVAPGA